MNMGTVYCPECGYEISDQETKCPFCDAELDWSNGKSTVGVKKPQSTKTSEQVYRVYQDGSKDNTINNKVQNDNAEKVLGTIASTIFWVGTIVCFIVFIVGLTNFLANIDGWSGKDERTLGLILMGASTTTPVYEIYKNGFGQGLTMSIATSQSLILFVVIMISSGTVRLVGKERNQIWIIKVMFPLHSKRAGLKEKEKKWQKTSY